MPIVRAAERGEPKVAAERADQIVQILLALSSFLSDPIRTGHQLGPTKALAIEGSRVASAAHRCPSAITTKRNGALPGDSP